MMPALGPRAVHDGTVSRLLVHHLALEDATVFERQMENVAVSGVRHRIEPHDRCRAVHALDEVADTAEVAMATMQTPYAPERLRVRQLSHIPDSGCKERTCDGCAYRSISAV